MTIKVFYSLLLVTILLPFGVWTASGEEFPWAYTVVRVPGSNETPAFQSQQPGISHYSSFGYDAREALLNPANSWMDVWAHKPYSGIRFDFHYPVVSVHMKSFAGLGGGMGEHTFILRARLRQAGLQILSFTSFEMPFNGGYYEGRGEVLYSAPEGDLIESIEVVSVNDEPTAIVHASILDIGFLDENADRFIDVDEDILHILDFNKVNGIAWRLDGAAVRDALNRYRMYINSGVDRFSFPFSGLRTTDVIRVAPSGSSVADFYPFLVSGYYEGADKMPQPGCYYKVSFLATAVGSEAACQVWWYDNKAIFTNETGSVVTNHIHDYGNSVTIIGGWHAYERHIYLPPIDGFIGWNSAAYPSFGMHMKVPLGCDVYIDDLRIERAYSVQPKTHDMDADGMPDWWEGLYNLNYVTYWNFNDNPDNDALCNLEEYVSGSNPRLSNDVPGVALEGTIVHDMENWVCNSNGVSTDVNYSGVVDAGDIYRMWASKYRENVSCDHGAYSYSRLVQFNLASLPSSAVSTSAPVVTYWFLARECCEPFVPEPGKYYRLSWYGEADRSAQIKLYWHDNHLKYQVSGNTNILSKHVYYAIPEILTLNSTKTRFSKIFYISPLEGTTFLGMNNADSSVFQMRMDLQTHANYYIDHVVLEEVQPAP